MEGFATKLLTHLSENMEDFRIVVGGDWTTFVRAGLRIQVCTTRITVDGDDIDSFYAYIGRSEDRKLVHMVLNQALSLSRRERERKEMEAKAAVLKKLRIGE